MNVLSRAALLAASLLLFLIAAEGALRLLDYPSAYRIPLPADAPGNTLVHRGSPIPGLSYELRPTGRFPERTNTIGIRDVVDRLDKPPGTRRIVCVGDSFTYGSGVSVRECYAKRLEIRLEEAGGGWQVLNLGVGGYCSRDEALFFRHRVPGFDPDLVIVAYALNDPDTDNTGGLHNYFREHPYWHRFHLLRLGKGVLRRFGKWRYGGYIPYIHRDDRYWGSVRAAFRDMAACARERDLPVLLVIFPVPPRGDRTGWDSYEYGWVHEQVRNEGEQNGFEVIDLLPVFRSHDCDSLRVSRKDAHPSPFAHDLAARRIARAVPARREEG